VAESHARQRESERLDRLAELDRTRTEFFANVSHEFRTPLTLMLAPLEELLRRREELPALLVGEVEVAASNSRRLLRLVNSLLDFSQLETRRQQANFEPTYLCAFTTDIASAFRSAIEAAGLRFRVECDLTLQPVWVDRDMWEKVVSNLLSNAFKFTFQGEIAVELHALSLHAELIVKDTGIGIPEQEMPNIFKRFHRIRGARARTMEGSGIGLSIVDDLVKRRAANCAPAVKRMKARNSRSGFRTSLRASKQNRQPLPSRRRYMSLRASWRERRHSGSRMAVKPQ
jgi:signal transduction histidine kinase